MSPKPPAPVGSSAYQDRSPEPVELIESLWGIAPHLANVIKYVARAPFKPAEGELRDLRKAEWYLSRALTLVKFHLARRKAEHEAQRELELDEHNGHVRDSYANPDESRCPHCGLPPGTCPE